LFSGEEYHSRPCLSTSPAIPSPCTYPVCKSFLGPRIPTPPLRGSVGSSRRCRVQHGRRSCCPCRGPARLPQARAAACCRWPAGQARPKPLLFLPPRAQQQQATTTTLQRKNKNATCNSQWGRWWYLRDCHQH
jgi:hypothetical protein